MRHRFKVTFIVLSMGFASAAHAADGDGGAPDTDLAVFSEPIAQQVFSPGQVLPPFQEPATESLTPAVNNLEAAPVQGSIPGILDDESPEPQGVIERLTEKLFGWIPGGDPGLRDKLVLTLGTSVGYDTNVLYSPVTKVASATASANGALEYKFGSRRLQLETELTGGVTYYDNRPGDSDDQNFQLILALDYRFTPRLSIALDTNTAYLSQPNPQLIGGVQLYSGAYSYTNTNAQVQYMLRPRVGLGVGFGVNGFRYDDEEINNNSGYFQENFSLSTNFLVSPRSTVVLQYRYNPVQYYQSGLGSDGHYVTVGLDQNLTRRFTSSINGGVEYRRLKTTQANARDSYIGPFVEGDMAYEVSPSFNVTGNLRFGTEPSGVASVTIRQTFRAGFSASNRFGEHFEAGLGVFYSNDNYNQPPPASDFIQDNFSGAIDLRYKFTRSVAATFHCEYTYNSSNLPDSAYTRIYTTAGFQVIF